MRSLQSSWSLIDRGTNKQEAPPLKKSVLGEIKLKKELHQRSILEALLLWELLRIKSGDTKLKRAIKREYKSHGRTLPIITRATLKSAYDHLTEKLTKAYEKSESRTTNKEKTFAEILRAFFPERLIHRGLWIGNHTTDVFLLYRLDAALGFDFEQDGWRHEEEQAISNKDDYKAKYLLTEHAITTKRILNKDIRAKTVFSDLIGIKDSGRPLDSKSEKNFWIRVYIETIAQCHRKKKFQDNEPNFFRVLVNANRPLLRSLLGVVETQKRSFLLKRYGHLKEKIVTRSILHPKQSRLQFRRRNLQTTKNKGEKL